MRKSDISEIFITGVLEIAAVVGAFMIAYYLRGITDGIPFVQMRIPYISYTQFVPYIFAGVCIWILVFVRGRLYSIPPDMPLFEEIRLVLTYSFFWFFIYIGFIYLALGWLFSKEIPRLIIIYVYIIATVGSIILRSIEHWVYQKLYQNNTLPKKDILVISDKNHAEPLFVETSCHYIYKHPVEREAIFELIRTGAIDAIISMKGNYTDPLGHEIIEMARIYGIPCTYPQIMPALEDFSKAETFIGGIPVIELRSVSITPWERIIKRVMDICISSIGIVILSPIFAIIYIGIKISDPSGPAIYHNRRIGQNNRVFDLYKFRYMYWKYSVKDAYGVSKKQDTALKFEEELKKRQDTRDGPLYKIQDDPRKMPFGRIIERLSLDELPQLYNVLRGDMSLVGPRPHQPREVEQYDEEDRQVLTIKPGITGMAQVYGRDKNTFKEEIALDTYYIEHYSIPLDLAILLRTVLVVISRSFTKKS